MASYTGDLSWGHLDDTEHFGRASNHTEYVLVPKSELMNPKYSKCTQAGHCMIYAKFDEKIFGIYKPRAAILMQMRFDGYIGFPGGLIDEGEDVLFGLNRELVEEMAIDGNGLRFVKEENHVVTYYNPCSKLCLHFFAVQVTLDYLKHIERNAFNAPDHGTEVLGTIRVPLYTMGDGFRGFPNFLTNSFVGNARQQLLHCLLHLRLMTDEEITLALKSKPV